MLQINKRLKKLIFGGHIKTAGHETQTYQGSIQKWLPVLNVAHGVVITKDHRFVKIIEVLPVNFYLKSKNDRQNIVYYFAGYLKIAPNSIQIRVMTQKADIEEYKALMRQYHAVEENDKKKPAKKSAKKAKDDDIVAKIDLDDAEIDSIIQELGLGKEDDEA